MADLTSSSDGRKLPLAPPRARARGLVRESSEGKLVQMLREDQRAEGSPSRPGRLVANPALARSISSSHMNQRNSFTISPSRNAPSLEQDSTGGPSLIRLNSNPNKLDRLSATSCASFDATPQQTFSASRKAPTMASAPQMLPNNLASASERGPELQQSPSKSSIKRSHTLFTKKKLRSSIDPNAFVPIPKEVGLVLFPSSFA